MAYEDNSGTLDEDNFGFCIQNTNMVNMDSADCVVSRNL